MLQLKSINKYLILFFDNIFLIFSKQYMLVFAISSKLIRVSNVTDTMYMMIHFVSIFVNVIKSKILTIKILKLVIIRFWSETCLIFYIICYIIVLFSDLP